jgi:hypothetical protein
MSNVTGSVILGRKMYFCVLTAMLRYEDYFTDHYYLFCITDHHYLFCIAETHYLFCITETH